MGWLAIACCVGTGAVAVAAIGIVGYAIYKSLEEKEVPNSYRSMGGIGKRGKHSPNMESYEDIKSKLKAQNPKVPENNKNSNTNGKNYKTSNSVTTTAPNQAFVSRKENQETQTCDFTEFLNSLPGKEVPLNLDDNVTLSQSDASSVVSDSVPSWLSSASTVDSERLNRCRIPRWTEMSSAEKSESICRACNKNLVTTVGVSCEHPYMCNECAPVLFKWYDRCPICEIKMSHFKNI